MSEIYKKILNISFFFIKKKMLIIDNFLDYISGILSYQNMIILTGETGSGKTLKIPQLTYFLGFSGEKKIVCTEPRRIAVYFAAKEISKRIGCKLGSIVGYSVRFEECFNHETKIKFITEGLLIKEWLSDPSLKNYSILIIDEAHERSSNMDVLFSLIKNQYILGLDLKVILMSATMNCKKFSKFFNNCPVLCIPGRNFVIKSFYLKLTPERFILNAIKTVYRILKFTSVGNILIFLKGKEEIDLLGHVLFNLKDFFNSKIKYDVFPVFSEISTNEQVVFIEKFSLKRKIILSTNISEASITIPNINFIIDTGLSKFNCLDYRWKQEKLVLLPISRLNANQRTGRTGRTCSGRCFRLYSKWSYIHELGKKVTVEIQRIDLGSTILFFKSLGYKYTISLDWLDSPLKISLLSGLKTLYLIGAVDKTTNLTVMGRKLVELPLKPMLGKSLIMSNKFNCKEDILYLACLLSISLFTTKDKNIHDFRFKASYPDSEHMIYSEFYKLWKSSDNPTQWCRINKLNPYDLNVARNIEHQLYSIMKKFKNSDGNSKIKDPEKALLSGFFLNLAKLSENGSYSLIFSRHCSFIKFCPKSNLSQFPLKPNLILFDHLYFNNTKPFMKIISVIKTGSIRLFSSLILNN